MTSDIIPQRPLSNILVSLKEIAASVMEAVEARTLEEVLQRISNVSKELVHARYAALGVPDSSDNMKYFMVAGVTRQQIHAIGHYPVGLGLLGVIMHERQALRLEDMSKHPRSVGFPPNHPPMTSLLGVPVQVSTQLYGMLYLTDREDGQMFTDEDQWLVETLAGYAALAIAGTQLSERNSRLTLLEERERVGRELHDGTIQSLYAIGLQLQLMNLSNPLLKDSGLPTVISQIDEVIEDMRRYILNLRVTVYEQQTVEQALRDVITQLRAAEKMTVQLTAPDRQPPFAPPVFEAVVQITREAISNVLRHANASALTVEVTESDLMFQLVVEDNGKGFELDALRNGMGMRNMQERTRIHGGTLRIHALPNQGTRLILTIPILKD